MPKPQSLSKDLQDAFEDLLCRMSPENISRDGKATASQIRVEAASINAQWVMLESKASRKVTREEVFKSSMRK